MVRYAPCIFLIASIWLLSPAMAHKTVDLEFILKFNPIETPQQHKEIRFKSKETSELKFFSTGLIRLYQQLISKHDLPTCNFSPSCSRFGMACIQEYGFFRGVLLTADRLLRDHGIMMSQHYHFDEHTGKYDDPIADYSQEALKR
jgi:uncharacterized protein